MSKFKFFLNLPKQNIINSNMEKFLSLFAMVPAVDNSDYVGFTFFVGCMAMMAASVFFFLSMNLTITSGEHQF